MTLTVYLYKVE